jgi:hypothetical protein
MKLILFLIPIIALTLTSILYYYLKKTTNKKVYHQLVFTIVALAFLFNLTWELIQIPLYKNASYSLEHIGFCALASIADAILVLLLFFGSAVLFKNLFWIRNKKWQQIIIVILIGGIGAVLGEMLHFSIGSWAYADAMPIIPSLNVGLSPILQFMILPIVIYITSFNLSITKQKNNHL